MENYKRVLEEMKKGLDEAEKSIQIAEKLVNLGTRMGFDMSKQREELMRLKAQHEVAKRALESELASLSK